MPKVQVEIDLPTVKVGEVQKMQHGSLDWKRSPGAQTLRMGEDETLGQFIRRVTSVTEDIVKQAILG
jgi:hypothetical protein